MNRYKLGKQPMIKHAPRIWLNKYINRSTLKIDQAPNQNFAVAVDKEDFPAWTNPLGNAKYGCCFWAAAFRYMMARLASEGRLKPFTGSQITGCVLRSYALATGFNPRDPQSDQGTAALAGMNYLQKTGLTFPDGSVHKIGSYAWIDPKDFELVLMAHNLFDGVMMGLEFFDSWEEERVWDITHEPVAGGHEVIGYNTLDVKPDGIGLNSWGMKFVITQAAIANYCDEIAVALSPELFGPNGKSISGFDQEQLLHDEQALNQKLAA